MVRGIPNHFVSHSGPNEGYEFVVGLARRWGVPSRLGLVLLWHAGMLYMFTVGLGL